MVENIGSSICTNGKAIEELTDGYLDEEISVPDYTETEMISSVFNKNVEENESFR